jgi:hypothetical protein
VEQYSPSAEGGAGAESCGAAAAHSKAWYPDELGEKGTLEETGVGKLVLWDVVSQHAQGSHVGLCMLFTFAAVASAYCVQTVVVIMFNYVI